MLLEDVELGVDADLGLQGLAGIVGGWNHNQVEQAKFDLEGDGQRGPDLVHSPKYHCSLSNVAFDIHLPSWEIILPRQLNFSTSFIYCVLMKIPHY